MVERETVLALLERLHPDMVEMALSARRAHEEFHPTACLVVPPNELHMLTLMGNEVVAQRTTILKRAIADLGAVAIVFVFDGYVSSAEQAACPHCQITRRELLHRAAASGRLADIVARLPVPPGFPPLTADVIESLTDDEFLDTLVTTVDKCPHCHGTGHPVLSRSESIQMILRTTWGDALYRHTAYDYAEDGTINVRESRTYHTTVNVEPVITLHDPYADLFESPRATVN